MNNAEKIVRIWLLTVACYIILFCTVVVAMLFLTGCVTSQEEAQPQQNPFDVWQQGGICVHLYYRRSEFVVADSGSTCSDGKFAEPVGHRRKQVADNCGESLALVDYRTIYGCRNVSKVDYTQLKL